MRPRPSTELIISATDGGRTCSASHVATVTTRMKAGCCLLVVAMFFLGAANEVSADIEEPREASCWSEQGDDLSCTNVSGCSPPLYAEPFPKCVEGCCECATDACIVVVQYNMLDTNPQYYCGECGSFGSQCNSTDECLAPDSFCDKGYCGCGRGVSSNGICTVNETRTTASPTNLALTGILILIIICNKCISSEAMRRRWRRFSRRYLSRNSEDQTICQIDADGTYHNPRGTSKSPSYVLGNHDFYASSDDPDLDWAIELSLREMTRRQSDCSDPATCTSQPPRRPAHEGTSSRVDHYETIAERATYSTTSDGGTNFHTMGILP